MRKWSRGHENALVCPPTVPYVDKRRLRETVSLSHGQNVLRLCSPASVFDHTLGNAPHPVPNCEAKPQWACLVLGWGTTRESHGVERVFFCRMFFLSPMYFRCGICTLHCSTVFAIHRCLYFEGQANRGICHKYCISQFVSPQTLWCIDL